MALWRFWFILTVGVVPPAAGAGLALLSSCSSESETVATIQASDPLQIRYSMGGESQLCYAVSVTVDGKVVKGYVLGAAHPAIAEFEREARTHVPEIPPPPPPPPAAVPSLTAKLTAESTAASTTNAEQVPQGPVSLAGFRAVDWRGNRVDLNFDACAKRGGLLLVHLRIGAWGGRSMRWKTSTTRITHGESRLSVWYRARAWRGSSNSRNETK